MKKKVLSCILALLLVFGCAAPAMSAEANAAVRASLYFDQCSIDVAPASNHQIAVAINLYGAGRMTKIGVQSLYIEQKLTNVWTEFDTLSGADHPEFYKYDSNSFYKTLYFTGTPGVQYRVTITALATNSTGRGTKILTSLVVTCP